MLRSGYNSDKWRFDAWFVTLARDFQNDSKLILGWKKMG